MLKTWIKGLLAYLVVVYGFLFLPGPGTHNLWSQYILLLPLYLFYVFSIKVQALNGYNKWVVNCSYGLAFTFASWLTFWAVTMGFLMVSCTFFTTCDL